MLRARFLTVAAAGLALFAGNAVAPPPATAQGLPVAIGIQDSPDWLLHVARDLKLFEKVGLTPTFVRFPGGPPMIEAVQSGSLDIASVGSVTFLMGLARGLDWKIIGINPEGAYSQGIVVRRDSGIAGHTDLKGKRIGVFHGSMAEYGMMMILRAHGITRNQVTIEYMTPEEQVAALQSRRIDAAAMREPWLQRVVHSQNARVIAREGDVGIYTNVDTYSVRRDWLTTHRPTAVRFLQALLMASDVIEKDPQVAVRLFAAEMHLKRAWVETIFENVPPPLIHQWANPRYTYSLTKNGPFQRRLSYLGHYLLDEGLIKQPVDVSDAMDVSLIVEASKGRAVKSE